VRKAEGKTEFISRDLVSCGDDIKQFNTYVTGFPRREEKELGRKNVNK
jgi:hypothetical protein